MDSYKLYGPFSLFVCLSGYEAFVKTEKGTISKKIKKRLDKGKVRTYYMAIRLI